jgi:hypothetical protein
MFIKHGCHLELWYVHAQLFLFLPLQDEHLFYHDGLPSYGNGDNCL